MFLQTATGGLTKASVATANGAQHGSQEVFAGKGSQEGAEKGNKRPAEEEATREAHPAVSLQLPHNAKRQKTDAEWGMVPMHMPHLTVAITCQDVCITQIYSSSSTM